MSAESETATVLLDQEQIDEASRLAEASHAEWKNAPGHYRNKPNTHRVGKLGEIGVEGWARAEPNITEVDSAFRDGARVREADLILDGVRIEVKTWSLSGWLEWGRCVAPQQVPAIRKKADGVVWCHWDETESRLAVAGWSTLNEIADRPIIMTGPAGRTIANHQIPVEELRPLGTIISGEV